MTEKKKLDTVWTGCAGRTRGTISIHADGVPSDSFICLGVNKSNIGKFSDGRNMRIFINSMEGEKNAVVVALDAYSIRWKEENDLLLAYSSSSTLVEYVAFVCLPNFVYEVVSYKNRSGSKFYRVCLGKDGAYIQDVTEELEFNKQESL